MTATKSGTLLREPGVRQLAVVTVAGFTGFALTLSALPSWAVAGGASESAAGAVTAILLVATVAVQAAVPALERRLGVPRLLGLGLVALAVPAPFYLLGHELWLLSALSAVRGAGFAVLTVLGALLTARVAPPHRHGEAVGIYGLGIAVPNLLAVPAGAALTLSGNFAWVAFGALSPLLALAVLPGLASAARAPAPPAEPTEREGTGAALRLVAGPALVLLVVTLCGGGLLTFLPIARPDGAIAAVGLFLFGATGALSRWRAGHVLSRVGSRPVLLGGLAATAVGLLAVAAVLRTDGTGAEVVLLVGAAVLGVGYGAIQNATQVVAFARAGARHQVTASAVWNAGFDAGTAIGSYGIGAVAGFGLGLAWTFTGCAALVIAAVPLALAARTP